MWGATLTQPRAPLTQPNFNPRSPCGERQAVEASIPYALAFQSTLPVWGATCAQPLNLGSLENFNPRSPCGERHTVHQDHLQTAFYFNPRSPCGERRVPHIQIDIDHKDFNPRSPCGERPKYKVGDRVRIVFQSTLPVWGATRVGRSRLPEQEISIHAPRVGSDQPWARPNTIPFYFNPRSPCGERLSFVLFALLLEDFNPRSPCGERLQRCTNLIIHLWRKSRIMMLLPGRRAPRSHNGRRDTPVFGQNRSANLPAFSVSFAFAATESGCPPAGKCSYSQSAPPSFHTGSPGSKSVGSPSPCP